LIADEDADLTSRFGRGSTPRSLLAVVGEGVVDLVKLFGRGGVEVPFEAQLGMKRKLVAAVSNNVRLVWGESKCNRTHSATVKGFRLGTRS
jgi:hypothetical protein